MKQLLRSLLMFCALFVSVQTVAQEKSSQLPGFLGGAGLTAETDAVKPRSLRFVTTLDFPPFNFLDETGKLNGFNVYLAKALCSELNIAAACTIQALPFAELEATLENGQADAAIAGLTANASTREKYLFSSAYLQFPARFVAMRSAKTPVDFAKGLDATRIGAISGSGHERLVRAFFPKSVVTGYITEDLMFKDLQSGVLDLAAGDGMRMSFWLQGAASKGCCIFQGGAYYSPTHLGEGMRIAFPATRPDLTAAVNQALASLQKKGVIAELYLRFFPSGFY